MSLNKTEPCNFELCNFEFCHLPKCYQKIIQERILSRKKTVMTFVEIFSFREKKVDKITYFSQKMLTSFIQFFGLKLPSFFLYPQIKNIFFLTQKNVKKRNFKNSDKNIF